MIKAAPMVQQHPPTPPSGPTELQYDFHHLVQHNANTTYKYEVGDSPYVHSTSQSAYGSPAPMMQHQHSGDPYMSPQYGISNYPEPHAQNEVGLGISMDGYGAPGATYYHDESHVYHGLPYLQQGMKAHTPPTPRSATASDTGRRTRSGTSAARTTSPSSKPRAPKSKAKKSSENKNKPKAPKLTAPLSELTKDFKIPVKNMEEWVNRSASVRRAEVEKRNGYVTRPMNSFMLYRSAYAERTKTWCLQNNHQVVSSVSGESWPLEPPEIREHYNELAKIERINHQNAHPTYKFSPSKASSTNRKRKGTYSDEEEENEPSDLDDPDAEWAPHSSRRSKTKLIRRQGREPTVYNERSFGPINKSTWEVTNEGRQLPAAVADAQLHHQYFQSTVHLHGGSPGIDEVHMNRVEQPGAIRQYTMTQNAGLIGMPGGHGQHHELLQLGAPVVVPGPFSTPGAHHEPQVDPMLLAYSGEAVGDQFGGGVNVNVNGGYGDETYGTAFLGDEEPQHTQAEWQVDSTLMPMEAGSEFDKWMDEHQV